MSSQPENENNENNENNETTNIKDNNWRGFFLEVIKSLITVLIVGWLGANYVFLTRMNLDIIFPSDVLERPYSDENKTGKLPPLCPTNFKMKNGNIMKGGMSNSSCGNPIDICSSKLFENKYFKGMFDYGFPYNLESKEETFGGFLSSWFSNKVKYSYSWLRTIVHSLISFTGSLCEFNKGQSSDIAPFVFGPVIMMLLLFISSFWFIPSMISIFVNETSKWGMLFSIVGLFFGWTWAVPMCTSFIQMFGLMFILIILPIIINPGKIIEIMGHDYNAYFMKILFFFLIIPSTFKNLNIIVAVVMTIIFLINLLPPKLT
jgi:hypothetical protein